MKFNKELFGLIFAAVITFIIIYYTVSYDYWCYDEHTDRIYGWVITNKLSQLFGADPASKCNIIINDFKNNNTIVEELN